MKKNKRGVSEKSSGKEAMGSAAQAELELREDQFKLTRFDYIAAPLLAFVVDLWVFSRIWTAINWDDLLYMSLSQHTVPQAWILNRYGHIYLQKFFFWMAGDAQMASEDLPNLLGPVVTGQLGSCVNCLLFALLENSRQKPNWVWA